MASKSESAGTTAAAAGANNDPLYEALRHAKLEKHYETFCADGIAEEAELALVQDADLERLGLAKFERMRFKRYFKQGKARDMASMLDLPPMPNASSFMPLLAGMGTGESELSEEMFRTLFGDSSGQEFGKAAEALRALMAGPEAVSDLNSEQIPAVLEHLGSDKEEEQMKGLKKLTDNVVLNADATQVHLLAQAGVVPLLVRLLKTSNQQILEKAVIVLGSISSDPAGVARQTVRQAGGLTEMLKIVHRSCDPPMLRLLRMSVWCVANLCEPPPMPEPMPAVDVIRAMKAALLAGNDPEVMSHACWALSHLCDGATPHVQDVVAENVCGPLTKLLGHRSWRVVKPALRTIGNIVCAEEEMDYTQHIVDHGTIPFLRKLVEHSHREIQKEACWTFSNIAAGSTQQIQCVLDSGVVEPLVRLASSPETHGDVKIEACWVLLNATSCGSDQQIETLVGHGCVGVLCGLLSHQNMVLMALEGIEKVMKVGDEIAIAKAGVTAVTDPGCGPNPYAPMLQVQELKTCASHVTAGIAKRAKKIVEKHFVVCKICNSEFTARTVETKWCPECKCTVCSNCDCTRFHLSYQLAQWDGLDSQEKSQASAKAAAKKRKRQKKKAKAKAKKAQAGKDTSGSQSRSPSVSPARAPEPESKGHPPAPAAALPPPAAPAAAGGENKAGSKSIVDMTAGWTQDDFAVNDRLVNFFEQTGSILELAKQLDSLETEREIEVK